MLWALLYLAMTADEAAAPATPQQLRFFETSVRPVLVEHCHGCHGAKKQWAGLRLDSREALLKGGDSGAAVAPGDPAASLLIQAVTNPDPDLRMPREGQLSERQIADLTRWVEMGAPYPNETAASGQKRNPNHWSFQPLAQPVLPATRDAEWPRNGVDRFILARLEEAGIAPAQPADRRTLIRRLTFDLTGLPPTPAEIEAFLADQAPHAAARLVDRLLSSPAYGERWGRHWLDVARYADSNGLDENVAHGNAWRYRDYVVAGFNADKPFDQFILEQLSGDLMEANDLPRRHELLTATGFLSIGAKVLAEVDQTKMQMDMVDEQIEAVGRAFLGLTLGCARCHDHKFDPIDAADYYGLAGIFKSTRTMDTYIKVAKWHENLLPSDAATQMQARYEAELAAKKRELELFVAAADARAKESLPEGSSPPEKLETLYPEETKAELKKLREALQGLEKDPPELPAAMGVAEDKVVDLPIHVRGSALKLGEVVPRRVPVVLRGPPPPLFTAAESGRRELAQWLIDQRNPLVARVFVNRVWRWHMGRGLVPSTDNFGLLGEPPSHPELLDWMARRFMADGWSLKSLHRLILSSNTYQQSASATAEAAARDPENRLFGRANPRRLEAEEIRDSLLAVSGQLDPALGGSLLKVKNRGYLFDHTSIDLTDYTSRRRSLYLPVIRNHLYDLFQLLDFPDPAVPHSDRATTTVAPQALLMLNSELVMQAAEDLARRLLRQAGGVEERIARLYEICYGRPVTAEECRDQRVFLKRVQTALNDALPQDEREHQAFSALCHVLLAANEFVYVR
jgi:cytochrome c553